LHPLPFPYICGATWTSSSAHLHACHGKRVLLQLVVVLLRVKQIKEYLADPNHRGKSFGSALTGSKRREGKS